MQIYESAYALASLGLAFYLIKQANNKWLFGSMFFLIYSTPILGNPRYTISIPSTGFDLQPGRIIFLFLTMMLAFFIFRLKARRKSVLDFEFRKIKTFEVWMIAYIGIVILVLGLNIDSLGAKTVLVSWIKWITFLLVYFFTRECVTPQDFMLLTKAILVFAIFSALVGAYQFLFDPYFFRIGVARIAFIGYVRGNGFFFSEYDQGIFLVFAAIVAVTTLRNKWQSGLIIIIVSLGVFFTMHRTSWAALIIILGILLVFSVQNKLAMLFVGAMLGLLIAFAFLNIPWERYYSGSFFDQLIRNRVEDDTLGVRMRYNRFALEMLEKYPLGIGDYGSKLYRKEAYKQALDEINGNTLIIHNGFLSAGVQYGIAGMLIYILFLVSTLIHALQREQTEKNIKLMIALVVITVCIYNMTQDFSSLGNQIGIFLGLLLGSLFSLNEIPDKPYPLHQQLNRN